MIITCEHGGNVVPKAWKKCFASAVAQKALNSHLGFDPGALEIAKFLARKLHSPLFYSTVTRLLVELNRSLHHRKLFSRYTQGLPLEQKQKILNEHYLPYRQNVEQQAAQLIDAQGCIVHLSIHTFTPVFNEEVRNAEIGFLYDPKRNREKELCLTWKKELKSLMPSLQIRCNYPYKGTSDGLTTYLRKKWKDKVYAGIELEVNQKLVQTALWPTLKRALFVSLYSIKKGAP